MKRVLIVDSNNLFLRSYIVNPSISLSGQPCGGLKGFLQALQKICRQTKPDMIVACWDGAGGSKKRKSKKKDYKAGRKPLRLNRAIRNLSEDQEHENKIWQHVRTMEYMNYMPVIQFVYESVEADDVIAYVTQHKCFEDWQKLIVSNDKDFYQLLDDKTVQYRPQQEEVLNRNAIVEKFEIHPVNITLARAMAGDKSDNLPGIGSCGLATAAKRFPFLKEETTHTLTDLLDYSKKMLQEKKLKVYENVVENFKSLKLNYEMMQLYAPLLSYQTKTAINNTLDEPELTFNRTEVKKKIIEDGLGDINLDEIFQIFNKIALDNS